MTGASPPIAARRWPARSTVVDMVPVALVVLAEAAWISAVGGLLLYTIGFSLLALHLVRLE